MHKGKRKVKSLNKNANVNTNVEEMWKELT